MRKMITLAAVALGAIAANAEVLWEGSVNTGNWGSEEGVSCVKIGKASFATAAEGDKLSVTISEIGEEPKLLYKDGSSWEDLVDAPAVEPTAPTTALLTLEQTTVDVLKDNGLILQGHNVTVTKVELTSNTKFEYKEVWTGSQEITWEGETAPRVTDAACADLKAGDVIAVTLSAIGKHDDWPKCCFRSVKDDTDITTLELWVFSNDPMPTTKNLVIEDPEPFKYGFYIVGCACTVTKIELGFKSGSSVAGETVLWEGDPTEVSWGAAGPTVSATKGAKLKANDVMEITVSSLNPAEEWPKVVCRCADGWDEIFTVELFGDDFANATFPYVAKVKITETMLPLLAKGFNFGGSGAYITKVALGNPTGVNNVTTVENGIVSVYTVNGICVRNNVEASNALVDLPAGLYIVNGKKYLKK